MVDVIKVAETIARTHHGERQRVGGEPETEHLRRVGEQAALSGARFGAQTATISGAVGWLHDILEDTPVKPLELMTLLRDQGVGAQDAKEIVRRVVELTHPPELTGLGREWIRQRELATVQTWDTVTHIVKCADIIDNAQSMREHKPDFFAKWAHEKRELIRKMQRADRAAGGPLFLLHTHALKALDRQSSTSFDVV